MKGLAEPKLFHEACWSAKVYRDADCKLGMLVILRGEQHQPHPQRAADDASSSTLQGHPM